MYKQDMNAGGYNNQQPRYNGGFGAQSTNNNDSTP